MCFICCLSGNTHISADKQFTFIKDVNDLSIRVDGTLDAGPSTVAVVDVDDSVLTIGASPVPSTYATFSMGETFIEGSVLAGDDLTNSESYLSDKWIA